MPDVDNASSPAAPTKPNRERGRPPRSEPPEAEDDRRGFEAVWRRLADRKGRTYTPWLVIRYNATDMGLRPIPPTVPFWISPDIWVESTDLLGRPVAGQPNYLHSRLFNLGKAPASPTRVDFYWGDPSLGLSSATMNLIGTEWVEVPAHSSRAVRCNTPWVPALVNNGHECVIVNSTSPILDPMTQPFQAWADRHVGQRNLTVIPAGAGQYIPFTLSLINPFPMLARTRVLGRVEHVRVQTGAFERVPAQVILHQVAAFGQSPTNTEEELTRRFVPGTAEARIASMMAHRVARSKGRDPQFVRGVGSGTRSAAGIYSKLSETGRRLATNESTGPMGHLFVAGEALSRPARVTNDANDLILHRVDLEANERRMLEIELRVPGNAENGEFIVFHMAQHTEAVPIGGYTIILIVGGHLTP